MTLALAGMNLQDRQSHALEHSTEVLSEACCHKEDQDLVARSGFLMLLQTVVHIHYLHVQRACVDHVLVYLHVGLVNVISIQCNVADGVHTTTTNHINTEKVFLTSSNFGNGRNILRHGSREEQSLTGLLIGQSIQDASDFRSETHLQQLVSLVHDQSLQFGSGELLIQLVVVEKIVQTTRGTYQDVWQATTHLGEIGLDVGSTDYGLNGNSAAHLRDQTSGFVGDLDSQLTSGRDDQHGDSM
mmetsp:Transcript_9309/g.28743  ORF Transcript_9309/g.28743 Transcript_9309/m.28743 type:complete len:243 (-) Transcript_9309:755-1483(-)